MKEAKRLFIVAMSHPDIKESYDRISAASIGKLIDEKFGEKELFYLEVLEGSVDSVVALTKEEAEIIKSERSMGTAFSNPGKDEVTH